MFLISVRFRHSRSKARGNKPGVVYFRITRRGDSPDAARLERAVNSDIHGPDESVMLAERAKIIARLRLLYCIIERRENSGREFSIDDVADDFRKALAGDASMAEPTAKSLTDFPLRSDIVTIGREFAGEFRFTLSKGGADLLDYIFAQSQSLKADRRHSLAKNYMSLLSSLRAFAPEGDVGFDRIGKPMVSRYAEWLRHTGISDSTQSFYLRNLRAVLNKARGDGLVGDTSGWFDGVNTGIERASVDSREERLDRDLLTRIENLDLSADARQSLVRDMFMFGFYCGGMELVDIAHLTADNVTDGVLSFRRRQKGHERKVSLGRKAMRIIERYDGRRADKHLFPLLALSDNDVLFGTIRNYVNRSMKLIGRSVDYPSLSFGMNATAYNRMLALTNLPELLLRSGS